MVGPVYTVTRQGKSKNVREGVIEVRSPRVLCYESVRDSLVGEISSRRESWVTDGQISSGTPSQVTDPYTRSFCLMSSSGEELRES